MKFFGNCGRICEQFMVQGPSGATAILCSIQHLLSMTSNLVGIQSEKRERLQDERWYYSEMEKNRNRPGPCNYLSNLVVNTVRFVIFTL